MRFGDSEIDYFERLTGRRLVLPLRLNPDSEWSAVVKATMLPAPTFKPKVLTLLERAFGPRYVQPALVVNPLRLVSRIAFQLWVPREEDTSPWWVVASAAWLSILRETWEPPDVMTVAVPWESPRHRGTCTPPPSRDWWADDE